MLNRNLSTSFSGHPPEGVKGSCSHGTSRGFLIRNLVKESRGIDVKLSRPLVNWKWKTMCRNVTRGRGKPVSRVTDVGLWLTGQVFIWAEGASRRRRWWPCRARPWASCRRRRCIRPWPPIPTFSRAPRRRRPRRRRPATVTACRPTCGSDATTTTGSSQLRGVAATCALLRVSFSNETSSSANPRFCPISPPSFYLLSLSLFPSLSLFVVSSSLRLAVHPNDGRSPLCECVWCISQHLGCRCCCRCCCRRLRLRLRLIGRRPTARRKRPAGFSSRDQAVETLREKGSLLLRTVTSFSFADQRETGESAPLAPALPRGSRRPSWRATVATWPFSSASVGFLLVSSSITFSHRVS